MLDRIEAAFARERTFVADASHELRTPLAILKTELELALGRGRTNEELTDALRSAAEETDRLVALAEDLLVIARSDQGQLPIRREELRVGELLERRPRALRARAEREATSRSPPPTGCVLDADPLRLEQALGNLLDNALRHGGGQIELAAEARGGAVRLHVRDDGAGLPGRPRRLRALHPRRQRARPRRRRPRAGDRRRDRARPRRRGRRREPPRGGADVWIELPRVSPRDRAHRDLELRRRAGRRPRCRSSLVTSSS